MPQLLDSAFYGVASTVLGRVGCRSRPADGLCEVEGVDVYRVVVNHLAHGAGSVDIRAHVAHGVYLRFHGGGCAGGRLVVGVGVGRSWHTGHLLGGSRVEDAWHVGQVDGRRVVDCTVASRGVELSLSVGSIAVSI